jgi:hypothetical protein
MEEITMYKFQLEAIKDALRLTANLNDCRGRVTAYDRSIMQSITFVDNALLGKINERVTSN